MTRIHTPMPDNPTRALCRVSGRYIASGTEQTTCSTCISLARAADRMVDKQLAARLAIGNPNNLPAVVIFDQKGAPSKAVLALFDERTPLIVQHDRKLWGDTDLVLYPTGGLTVPRERFANRLGGLICLLESQTNWLMDTIRDRLASWHDVRIFIAYTGCEIEK
jgi:hypothetical protein